MYRERLSMHPYRGIVRTYRRSDFLSTISDDQNNLNRQYADTYNAPRDPLCSPITFTILGHIPTVRYSYVYFYGYIHDLVHFRHCHDHHYHCTTASRDRPLPHQVSEASVYPTNGIN